jgi:hypothetical protein
MPKYVQTSFAGGEITDSLEGRIDFDKQRSSVSGTRNVLVEKFGGLIKRSGTEFIGRPWSRTDRTSDPADVVGLLKIVPFRFSSTDSYLLVFSYWIDTFGSGTADMFVVKNGAFVQSGGSNYYVAHPFPEKDFSKLRWVQDADSLYFTHPDVQPQKLTRTADDNWTWTAMSFTVPTAPTGLTGSYYFRGLPISTSSVTSPNFLRR